MAQKVLVRVTSDLSGKPDAQTVRFSYEGFDYEIDLTEAEHSKLGGFLSTYMSAARRAGRTNTRSKAAEPRRMTASTGDSNAVRAWAKANGIEVSDRGRVPARIQTAYENRAG
jgi:hypothetical protein